MVEAGKHCQDCGSELSGEYCSACGQRDVDLKVPFKDLLKELGEELLSFDHRFLHSLKPFLFKPGALTLEYIAGRRTRHISPFKLYFFMSFIFFFTSALMRNQQEEQHPKKDINADSLMTANGVDTVMLGSRNGGGKFNLTVSQDSSRIEKRFGHRFAAGLQKLKANPDAFTASLREHTPQVIFLLLPIFALLLKLVYVRSKVYYVQHIVFAFFFHSYVFFILFCVEFLSWSGAYFVSDNAYLLYAAIPVNLYLGLRHVYKQSRIITLIKFVALGTLYFVAMIAALAVAVFVVISLL